MTPARNAPLLWPPSEIFSFITPEAPSSQSILQWSKHMLQDLKSQSLDGVKSCCGRTVRRCVTSWQRRTPPQMQASLYYCSILRVSRGFTPSDHINLMTACCSSMVATAKRQAILCMLCIWLAASTPSLRTFLPWMGVWNPGGVRFMKYCRFAVTFWNTIIQMWHYVWYIALTMKAAFICYYLEKLLVDKQATFKLRVYALFYLFSLSLQVALVLEFSKNNRNISPAINFSQLLDNIDSVEQQSLFLCLLWWGSGCYFGSRVN